MLITKTVKVKWNPKNREWYESKGYIYTKHNAEFDVNIEDITKGSHVEVEIVCDYCLENELSTVVKKQWKRYVKDNLNSVVKKDCCASCQPIKTKECNLINFGVENKMELPEIKEKQKNTIMKNYGVEHNMKNKNVRQKAIDTFVLKYGVDNPMKNKDVIKKSNQSKIKRFGSTNPFTNEEVINKSKKTNLQRYGTEWHMQSAEVMKKSKETMYSNGTAPCSRQQKYIHNLIGGELNYPVDKCSLDIAFPQEKIYVEYDGNGHDLCVKLGSVSYEEFSYKEIKRYQFLKSKGWKKIKMSSPADYLPSDNVLINEINKAKSVLLSSEKNHYIIEFGTKVNDIDYGTLRRITESDLSLISGKEEVSLIDG